jgi:hypothetical protein
MGYLSILAACQVVLNVWNEEEEIRKKSERQDD